MDTEPLLPTHLLDSLPEYSKVSHFSAPPASPASSYKEHIIFGTHPSPLPHGAHLRRHDLDLPSCDRYFASESVKDEHYRSKCHKKRVKVMSGPAPHTQLDADLAAGMGMPDNGLKLMSM